MLRKGLFFAVLFVLMTSFAWAQTTEEAGTVLQWKFKKGESLRYVQTANMTQEMALPIGKREIKFKMKIEYLVTVKDLDDQGVAKLKMKVDKLKLDLNMGASMNLQFDSEKPGDLERAKSVPQLAMLTQLVGKSVDVNVDKTGRIQDVSGIPNVKGSGRGIGGMVGGMAGLDKGKLKQIFLSFPMGPISKGATWSQSSSMSQGGMPMEVENKYKLEDIVQKDGEKTAKISGKTKLKLDLSKNPMLQNRQMKVNIKRSDGTSDIHFSIEKGKIVSRKDKMNLLIEMSGSQGGQNFSMTWKVTGNTVVKLVTGK